MKILKVNNVDEFKELNISERSQDLVYEKMEYTRGIVNDVRLRKDEALKEYTQKFDGIALEASCIKVSEEEFAEALSQVEDSFVEAIQYAISNVSKYHKMQLPQDYNISIDDGIILGRKWLPIERVGLYIPGGKAPYATICYMLGVPAQIAGCKNIIACAPADRESGKINPYILVSAYYAGIKDLYKVGGAQAIAAMAYGTETIPKVGKIFGPGNVYVTAAKLLVYGAVDIDSPAGPSEALIIADETAPVKFVAADMISQAEHDVNSAAVLLTTSEEFAKAVEAEVYIQIETLNRKKTILESLGKYGAILICPDMETCIEIANEYGAEHLQIMTANSSDIEKKIINAGSICLGNYSPIAMGDYVSGVNNVIPTGGGVKSFSPVHVESYMKCIQTQNINIEGLKKAQTYVETISRIEGFDAHDNSIKIRLNNKEETE